MRMAYLGLFSTVFNWVFDRILAPVLKFVAGLLSSVLEWAFNTVLMPLLTLVFKTLLPWAINLIVGLLSGLLYRALSLICKTLDYSQETLNIFAGSQNVIYKSGTTNVELPLLDAIFYQPEVRNMYIAVAVAGVGLAFIFAIIAVIKSTLDIDFEGKRPVGAVLRSLLRTILNFLMINILVVFLFNLSGVVLNAINQGSDANSTSLGRIVFCVSTFNAHKNPEMNIDKFPDNKNIMTDSDRKYFYLKDIGGALDYTKTDDVTKYFDIPKLDFFVAGVVGVFLVAILFATGITFVQRIFEVIILYIVSPFFVATMPLDEGEKFKKWKELFIAKIFGGYGSVLAMNLFLVMVPFIMGNSISWGENSAESSYLFKLLFLCGGAYAITKVGPMITTLINWQAGQAESATMSFASGLTAGAAMKSAFNGVKAFGVAAGRQAGKPLNTLFGKGKGSEIADKKWNQMNEDGIAEQDKDKDLKPEDGENKADLSEKKGEEKEKSPSADIPDKRWGISKLFDAANAKMHQVFPMASDEKGNYGFRFLGFGVNYDKDGRRTGIKIPGLSFKVGKDGGYSLDKVSVAGLVTLKRGGATGTFGISSVPAIGLKRFEDSEGNMRTSSLLGFNQELGKDGQMHVTDGLFGINRSANPDGTYHTDSIMGMKFGRAYNEATGQYESKGVRIGNMIFTSNSSNNPSDRK